MQKFTGKQYLQIDIANNFGQDMDKANWDVRLQWFKDNEHRLLELMNQAENPALYYAGIQAWFNVQQGKPTGYPISLDATSSGLQILAALTGDRKAASICNVINTGKREDAYTVIYDRMTNTLVEKYGDAAGGISRDDCKDAIMTGLYGSRAVPKEVFGEGVQLSVFYKTMSDSAPAAWELNEAFLGMWDPEALSHDWVLPDNFHVHVKVMDQVEETVQFLNQPVSTFRMVNQAKEEGLSLGANTTHSIDGMIVREMARRCDYDVNQVLSVINALDCTDPWDHTDAPERAMCQTLWDHYERSGYLSARILDYITHRSVDIIDRKVIWDLIKSLPSKPFKVISVHDCFRVLPNYGNDLREQYNLQLALIAKSNLLQDLLSQITKRNLKIGKLDYDLWKDILVSEYSLS